MIILSHFPVDPTDIEYLPSSSTERNIIETMGSSDAPYDFDSLGQLKFELTLRMNIIAAAKELERSGVRFAKTQEKCCQTHWDLIRGIGVQRDGFKLKEGVNPSEAITNIFENGSKYAFECSVAPGIVFYKAILDSFGEDIFDNLFVKIYLTSINWGTAVRDLKLTWQKAPDYFPGDRRYFNNPDVHLKKFAWKGENVIDLGDGTYYGHGIGIKSASTMIYLLNKNRKRGAVRSAYLEDKAGRPDIKYLANYAIGHGSP